MNHRTHHLSNGDTVMMSYIPELPHGAREHPNALYAWLSHHVAESPSVDPDTTDWFANYFRRGGIICHKYGWNGCSVTDPAHRRFTAHLHSLHSCGEPKRPFAHDTPEGRMLHDQLFSAIAKKGLELGMKHHHIPHIKFDLRGYEKGGKMTWHDDSFGLLNGSLSGVRVSAGFGSKKDVSFKLMQFESFDETPVRLKQKLAGTKEETSVPIKTMPLGSGMKVYAMSPMGAGRMPLGYFEEDNGGRTYVQAMHQIEETDDRHVSLIIDFWFETHKEAMYALELLRKHPFTLDFSSTDIAKKWLYSENMLRVS